MIAVGWAGTACAQRDQSEAPPDAGIQLDQSAGWQRPRTSHRQTERHSMVRTQIAARGIAESAVLEAMRNVPRHWFVPASQQASAYADHPLPIGERQTISQPYIVALMTQSLGIKSDAKVLEIGTGSGYQAAVLAEITPHVYTIEIVVPLAERAFQTFARYRYTSIQTKVGDGYGGWPEHAPFDAIIVTCAPDHIPPKLIEQLKPGGRMCIPVGGRFGTQALKLVTKGADGRTTSSDVELVRFVPMTGDAQRKDH